MNSFTEYNRNHEGAFNHTAQPDFREVTEQDRQEAQERLEALIRKTQQELGE
jgi:hypothetical protein